MPENVPPTYSGQSLLLEHTRVLAGKLSDAALTDLCKAIDSSSTRNWRGRREAITQAVPHPRARALAAQVVDSWERHAPDVTPSSLSFALRMAGRSHAADLSRQSVELVWTGPETDAIPLRRTAQVLMEVISQAKHEVTIVSFAVHRAPGLPKALVGAARRGVAVRLIAESSVASGGKMMLDGVGQLSHEVAGQMRILVWPREKRPTTADGRFGLLHAKCVEADGDTLFVSSANLTAHALNLNMELGLAR
jgi:phosphatidylserine/phosphatidylglycerophosphate/cardiolipin synthase-like enzyme